MTRKTSIALALAIVMSVISPISQANDAPPGSINSLSMSWKVGQHFPHYMNFKIIGVCTWLHWSIFGPYPVPTPEVDEYLPDLVVSVYNQSGDNPWFEARNSIDTVSQSIGSAAIKQATGFGLSGGTDSNQSGQEHADGEVAKYVDVIGAPMNAIKIPFVMLRRDTTAFVPYYQSATDTLGLLGLAEKFQHETYLLGHYIGQGFSDHWAYEFPRDMSVDNNNDFKASLAIALHAVDIVTNKNTGHTVISTNDSCGTNCAVSNVIEEQHDDHEKWQEVYPLNRQVHPGESDKNSKTPIGQEDAKSGNGNYVFVVWRHYRGCIQSPGGHLIVKTVTVPDTQKR